MRYTLSAPEPNDHIIQIELLIVVPEGNNEVLFQLPSWRPGRYELGNFAKNVRSFKAFNENDEPLAFRKTSKDCWKVLVADNTTSSEIHVKYSYYAAQADAGSCWVDEDLFYINPIHCCLYVPELMHEECTIELDLPGNFVVASSLESNAKQWPFRPAANSGKTLTASNYHELVDSPILSSPSLEHQSYEVEKKQFHIWVHGDFNPDWARLINDFRRFTKEQILMMGSIPTDEYHFLVLALPYKFHHGVEHLNSTMLAYGPGYDIMKDELYADFIGLASHELFHVWNVKTIRPEQMLPYDYTKENYSRLGFVYEGVTTYYGDLFLRRCSVFTEDQFFKEISSRLQKHLDNYGRFNLSVADSSFDTWLDGYTPGIPWRKTSIYDEGCLIALMCDLIIRRKTNNDKSLDDVMRTLYEDFGKKQIGYSEHDYLSIIENLTNESTADFFFDYVYGTEDYEPLLNDLLFHFGCEIKKSTSSVASEHHFGFKTSSSNNNTKVTHIAPGSPASKAGLSKDDEIIAVDERKVENNLNELLNLFLEIETHPKILLKVFTSLKKLKTIALEPSAEKYFQRVAISKIEDATTQQQKSFSEWMRSSTKQATRIYGMN
jgi:predicted metalloprotease with PDZ domain